MIARRIWNVGRVAAMTGALALLVSVAGAQDSAGGVDNDASAGFNIPANVKILAPMDPNHRHATARVNGAIITGTDVDQRMALVIASNNNAKLSDDEIKALRLQVLRNLIDETLEIQEAKAQDIAVKPDEVDRTFDRLARERFNQAPDAFAKYLRSVGSSATSLKRQIEGELAWNNLVQRNVQPFVSVSGEEVKELYDRLQSSKGTAEYRIGEIFLSDTPQTRDAVFQNAKKIVDQIKAGGSFPAYARQFSEASTAAVGGELGWIRLEQLQNPTLEQAVRQLSPGELIGPLEIPGGFDILLLIDKRQIGVADPRDAVLSLKQISLDFPKGTTEDQAKEKAQVFADAVKKMHGCGTADAAAKAIGAEVVDNDQVQARQLPAQLQPLVLQLNVGEATPPFGSLTEGVRVLMLCGRDDPKAASAGPKIEELQAQLEDDRVNKRAQRYLRDLRRDAVIEYDD